MEIVIHKYQPYEDTVRVITEDERQDPAFARVEELVNVTFQRLGARVVRGIADAGAPPKPPELSIPPEQSEAMIAFSERPA